MPEHTIAENLSRLVTAKTDIANAITTMGGTVGQNDGFEEFPADIATIPKGGEAVEIYGIPNGWVLVDGFPEPMCLKNIFDGLVVYYYIVIGRYTASGSSNFTFAFDIDHPYSTSSYFSSESRYSGAYWSPNTQLPSTTISSNSVTVTGSWGHIARENLIVCLNGFVLLNV